MIFGSKNEQGVPAYELVASGIKRVTRRLKPKRVGSVIAVQPARATKAVCQCGHPYSEHYSGNSKVCWCDHCFCVRVVPLRVRVVSCEKHLAWLTRMEKDSLDNEFDEFDEGDLEARHEGFNSWAGLLAWFKEHNIDINATYRIQFEKVKEAGE